MNSLFSFIGSMPWIWNIRSWIHCAFFFIMGAMFYGCSNFSGTSGEMTPEKEARQSYESGVDQAERGDTVSAVQSFEKVLQTEPDMAEAHLQLAILFNEEVKASEAAEHAREVLRINPSNPEGHHQLGLALGNMNQLEQALDELQKALKLDNEQAEVHHHLAILLMRMDRFSEAFPYMQQALKLDSKFSDFYNDIAISLSRKGEEKKSVRVLQEILDLDPNNTNALSNLAVAYAKQADFSTAIYFFKKVLSVNPDEASVHVNLANLYTQLGEHANSAHHYRKALKIRKDWVSVMKSLAWLLSTHPDEEIRSATEAVEIAEVLAKRTGRMNPKALDILAAAYAEAGDFKKAVPAAEEAYEWAWIQEQDELSEEISSRLALYQQGLPYHGRLQQKPNNQE